MKGGMIKGVNAALIKLFYQNELECSVNKVFGLLVSI
jgi:hypothetical protein